MIRPISKVEDLLLSITKNYEMFFEKTHKKAEETSQFKLTKPRDFPSFKQSPNLGLDCDWMVGLTIFQVYNSIFKIREQNNKFKFFTD